MWTCGHFFWPSIGSADLQRLLPEDLFFWKLSRCVADYCTRECKIHPNPKHNFLGESWYVLLNLRRRPHSTSQLTFYWLEKLIRGEISRCPGRHWNFRGCQSRGIFLFQKILFRTAQVQTTHQHLHHHKKQNMNINAADAILSYFYYIIIYTIIIHTILLLIVSSLIKIKSR